jgi:tetratricopeptide (TPR) repeat protein
VLGRRHPVLDSTGSRTFSASRTPCTRGDTIAGGAARLLALVLRHNSSRTGKKGEHDRSLQDFDAAIKLDAKYASAFANRAETYLYKGDYQRAARDYDEVFQLQPTWAVARNGRCWAHAIIGNLQLALADCNEALRLEPNVAATFDSRGLVHLKMAQWDAAIADYNAAIKLNPKQAGSLYGRGFAKLKKGDPAGTADTEAAIAMNADISKDFARYGVR